MTHDWDRIHALLHEALGLEPIAREEFLASLADTSAAEAVEVRSLLAAHAASTGFLDEPPDLQTARSVPAGIYLVRLVTDQGAATKRVSWMAHP